MSKELHVPNKSIVLFSCWHLHIAVHLLTKLVNKVRCPIKLPAPANQASE